MKTSYLFSGVEGDQRSDTQLFYGLKYIWYNFSAEKKNEVDKYNEVHCNNGCLMQLFT